MKRTPKLVFLAGLLLAGLSGGSAFGKTVIVSDTYTVTTSTTGFTLDQGVNFGINPPTKQRLTGSAAANLRYARRGNKGESAYGIASNKINITKGTQAGRFTISEDGSNPLDFGTVLFSPAATPTNPAVYELAITMSTGDPSARVGFAWSTTDGSGGSWNFGVQIAKSGTGYNVYKRIKTSASGLSAELNSVLTNTGTAGNNLSFVMHVTDAGPETTTYTSRLQLSLDGGTTWFYDTQTDPDLSNGWHFENGTRYVILDQEINANGPDGYDTFSVTWFSGPTELPMTVRTWTGGGADNNWSTANNWGGTAPASGDMLVFDGATRQTNTNDFSDLTAAWLTFKADGFALYGNAWTNNGGITNLAGNTTIGTDLAWGSTLTKVWALAPGTELVLNNTNTVEIGGDHNIYGGGTLRVRKALNIGQATTANPAFVVNEGQLVVDGGVFASRGGFRLGSLTPSAAPAQTILTNGATMNLTLIGANLRMGDSSNALTSRLVVNNSTLMMTGGRLYVPYAAGATSVVSQVGGMISGCQLQFGNGGAALGSYTNQNGTLEAYMISEGASGVLSYMYFDNAVLRALSGATNAFMSGLNRAEIQAGGLTFDAQGDVTVAQNWVGAGALIKTGYGALTLTGNPNYTGNTLVNQGKLVMPTGKTYPALIQVADNAEFGVVVKTAGAGLTNGSLTLGGGSSSTLSFDLDSFSNPTAPLLTTTNLVASGVVHINVANGFQLQPGTITLVQYSGSIGGNGFNAFDRPTLPPGVTAHLVNNSANKSIDLAITEVLTYTWTGAQSGDWDYWTQNWLRQSDNSPTAYTDGYTALFLDGARGDVNLTTTTFTPAAIIVTNNNLTYTWSGGAFFNLPIIMKYGTNSVTRTGGEADVIGGIELNDGSYVLNNVYDQTFNTVLTDTSAGLGTLVKAGASKLTVNSTNSTYDGTVFIKEGSLKINNDRALGSTTARITIANGATLDLNDCVPGNQPVTVSGDGTTGQGAIIDSGSGSGVSDNLRDVTLLGDTTFGGVNRWDLRIRSSTGARPGLRGNGYKLTKVGSGHVSIASQRNLGANTLYWHMNLGDVIIQQGTLTFAEALTPDNPSAALAIYPGAIFNVYDLGLTNPLLRNITMTNAQVSAAGNATDTNIFNGNILLDGDNRIWVDSAQLIINGTISGNGTISLWGNSPGTLTLNGINTYTGETSVTNSTLAGNGTLAGNLVMYGGTNAPGWDGVGTFTVNGNVTLGGTTLMELNRSRSPNSDRLVAGGSLAFKGILQVVLGAGAPAPQSGDVYRLFNKGGSGGFTTVSLPHLSSGLSWDTSKLTSDGTLSVTGTVKTPAISSVGLSGANFVFSGTNGGPGDTYYVLTSTNAAAPAAQWRPLKTNVFGPDGSFSYTNTIDPALPASFFKLQVP
jgi:autotransporter-associated beta strand protein